MAGLTIPEGDRSAERPVPAASLRVLQNETTATAASANLGESMRQKASDPVSSASIAVDPVLVHLAPDGRRQAEVTAPDGCGMAARPVRGMRVPRSAVRLEVVGATATRGMGVRGLGASVGVIGATEARGMAARGPPVCVEVLGARGTRGISARGAAAERSGLGR